jgi:hypothetical protein
MNRRGFLGALAALIAAPQIIFAKITGQAIVAGLTGQPRRRVPFAGAQIYGNAHLLVRATEPVKAHSIVVWDSSEIQPKGEIPLVRAGQGFEEVGQHILVGRAAVTNCDLATGIYGVATTSGDVLVRVEGA